MNDPYSISRIVARPLSIGLYSMSLAPRGSFVHCAALADALHAQGHDVTVYGGSQPDAGSLFRPLRARLIRVPVSAVAGASDRDVARHAAQMRAFLAERSAKHDVHHAQDWLTGTLLSHLRQRLQGVVVRTVHHVERFESPYLEHCQAHSIRGADAVFAVSNATASEVLARYGVRCERVDAGVEPAHFGMPPARDVVELGVRLGLSSAGPVLFSYGGVELRKNTIGVLRAFLALRKRLPSARWVIVGHASPFEPSHTREAFDAALAEASEADRAAITFAGELSERDLLASYQLADAVVCASLKEGNALVALDALAAGVPLIASRLDALTEHLDEACATLVDPGSHEALASALWRVLVRGRGDRARLSSGIERARRLTWLRSAAEHLRLYRELRARRAPDTGGAADDESPTTEARQARRRGHAWQVG